MRGDIHSNDARDLVAITDLLYEDRGASALFLFEKFTNLAILREHCDICTTDKVYLNALIDRSFLPRLKEDPARSIEEFYEKTSAIDILYEKGKTAKIAYQNIVSIYGMPEEPTESELAEVDLDEGDEKFGNSDSTIKEVIASHYLCKNEQETEQYLRRYLASR